MFTNYLKIAWRNIFKNKLSSFINIAGLASGMTITILIGLWIWDELSFDKYHDHYNQIGQLWQFVKFDAVKASYNSLPQPLAAELRDKFPDIKKVSLATYNRDAIIKFKDIIIDKTGMFVQPDFPEMMTFKILEGSRDGLTDPSSILISSSLARNLFKDLSPLNQVILINNKNEFKIIGVYEDPPNNSTFYNVHYLAPWAAYLSNDDWAKKSISAWDENSWPIYVELNEHADFSKVSALIKDIRMNRDNPPAYKPEFFIHPMSKWHLQGEFNDGQNTGGLISILRMIGIVGIFVLLLACVNFMNLSTARSGKRAKEVGIRKTVGSLKSQLVAQFYIESTLMAFGALFFAIVLIHILLPIFNQISEKHLTILWSNLYFWMLLIAFTTFTSLIAGSYPAFYLSNFQPVRVLKGSFKMSSFANISRKSLVVFQYVISSILIVGTMVVYKQINFAKERDLGYNKNKLIEVKMMTNDFYGHYDALRNDLIRSGGAQEMSQSMGGMTVEYGGTTNISWKGKAPGDKSLFMNGRVTHDFGNTVGWKLTLGRDFSREYISDSGAVVINEAALKLMKFKDPLIETIKAGGRDYKVIGVVHDLLKFDPFQPVKPYFFTINYNSVSMIIIKLSTKFNTSDALSKLEKVFKEYAPSVPFEYTFVDDNYTQTFATQVKIGRLSAIFSVLAIFISCLGLFGLASFMAEQRTKEIGVRKVVGASVFKVWALLSKDFILLSILSLMISFPMAYYLMSRWLEGYTLRVKLSFNIFLIAAISLIFITIATISFQAIKAAIANPIKSLRSE